MSSTAPLTPQEASRQAREATYRSHILNAAERLIGLHGLDGTRMQDVATEARVVLATIYRHYPTKHEVFLALVDDRTDAFFDKAHRAVDAAGTAPLERLVAYLGSMIDFCFDNTDTLRFILRTTPSWGLGDHITSWRPQRDYHAELVARCIDEGTVVGTDAVLVARQMVAILQVHLSSWLEHDMQADPDGVARDVMEQLERSFFATTPITARAPRRKRVHAVTNPGTTAS